MNVKLSCAVRSWYCKFCARLVSSIACICLHGPNKEITRFTLSATSYLRDFRFESWPEDWLWWEVSRDFLQSSNSHWNSTVKQVMIVSFYPNSNSYFACIMHFNLNFGAFMPSMCNVVHYSFFIFLLLVPRNFSRGRGVIPSLAERGEQSCQHGYYQFEM
jgi:hypothetical protein